MPNSYVQIDPKDNLVVAIHNLPKNTFIDIADSTFTLNEDIKQKHKFALYDFQVGDSLFMYGVLVGKATKSIAQGTAITMENVKHASADFKDSKEQFIWKAQIFQSLKEELLMGTTEPMEVLAQQIIGW